MFTVTLRKLTAADVYTQIMVEQDFVDPADLFAGDPLEDRKAIAEINERLDRGDVWAWCTITVKVSWRGQEASCGFGGGNYSDESSFRQSQDFLDLQQEAIALLNKAMQTDVNELLRLAEWETIGDDIVIPADLTVLSNAQLDEWFEVVKAEAESVKAVEADIGRRLPALRQRINKKGQAILDERFRRKDDIQYEFPVVE